MSTGDCRLRLINFCFQGSITEEIMGSSVTDESHDLGYEASSSSFDPNDQSTNSPMSTASFNYCRTSSEMSTDSCSEAASPVRWNPPRAATPPMASPSRLGMKKYMYSIDSGLDELEIIDLELEIMKERFSKLLLGEDMSGGGKGVCTAVTISNAITNLYATIFGNALKLEPMKPEKKMMWKKEMDCLLSVCDYIVEFVPEDGQDLEVMCTRPRTDIQMNLPALRKLDGMLMDILDSFEEKEFWYAEQGNATVNSSRTTSFRKVVTRKDEKWWLPIPCIPPGGLPENGRKHLKHQRDCANQIHKAAMAINSNTLNEMEVPESYIIGLPKSGKSCLGDAIYKYMYNAEYFSPDHLLDTLKINSEHEALDLADRVEASMYTWKRKSGITHSRSWNVMKDYKSSEPDRNDKNHVLAERAESLLFFLKHRFPGLSQTTLDTCKIQYNRDVGQAILESYSRVLEGFAFNVAAWVDDVLSADRLMKNQEQ
ncbi:rop guanine nucleotide exchange factor 4 isoform X3 [Spinacia oleracea]|uniref:Rop guanine nucleotide exchange factor 4 isoform X3 n=1 Tax=Spinacia oleracea TaxID=3562 RepID=A0A9R0IIG8_SPIOL|nr:rop guanine nucleotide exchange factor 4 isoform X3 [Spinacia oleracea]